MDDRRFDALVKSLAGGRNRRSVLKGLLGIGGAAAVGSALREPGAEAAKRPAPTPKPIKCPGSQHWDGTKCTCSTGETCGPDCCLVGSECCDGACCFGHCYGEELCCSNDNWCEAAGACCLNGETCCDELGCVVIEDGDCGCDGECPSGFECCGGQCCASGFCAGDICCALGVCGGECIPSPDLACCVDLLYEPSYVICCEGTIYVKENYVCCDDVAQSGNCCINADCGTCGRCLDYQCENPTC